MSDEERQQTAEETAAEPQAPEGGNEGSTDSVDDMQLRLEEAQAKADEHWEQVMRLRAELENTRRRAEQDVEKAHKFGLERFALELLPVKDSLELGLAAAEGDDENVVKLREGVELTLKMLTSAMAKFGIQEVEPVGEPFDPQLHQAMTMQENSEYKPNTVLNVMQKGYLLHDRLIRPAMVIVSREAGDGSGSQIDEKA